MDKRGVSPSAAVQSLSELPWDDLRLLLAVIEAGSFNRAARVLQLGQATVSRRLAELEAKVGHALFTRSVAGVTLTPLGEEMVTPLKRMAEWASEVHRAASRADRRVAGVVRVTAAPLVCATLIAQFAARLRSVHPLLRLEVLGTVRYLDLARGEADLAVRSVQERHGDLTSVTRVTHRNHVYVSKKLARTLGSAPDPERLPWLGWSAEFDHMAPNPQLRERFPGFAPVFTADNFLVLLGAAEAGVGAIVLAEPVVKLMPRTPLVPLEVPLGPYARSETHVVAAASALRLPKVRAVADELSAYLRDIVDD